MTAIQFLAIFLAAAFGFGFGLTFSRLRGGQSAALSNERARVANERVVELTEERNLLADQLADTRLHVATERQGIEAMVKPVADNLSRLEAAIARTESARRENLGGLSEQLRDLGESTARVSAQTAELRNVLRSSNARGRWGEVQLRRVVEVAGMLNHVDFAEQSAASSTSDSQGSRADMVVRLPGGVSIPVDAKVPFSAYDQACEATEPQVIDSLLRAHAKSLKGHVDELVHRAYWDSYGPTPGFCVLFVPGEALLEAALSVDATLWEHASRNRILFATPTTLIGLLRMAALGWSQESQAEDALEIAKIGRELHKRLVKSLGDVDKVGKGLRSAITSYNQLVGSLDSRVMPQARRLGSLTNAQGDSVSSDSSIIAIDETPRPIQSMLRPLDEAEQA